MIEEIAKIMRDLPCSRDRCDFWDVQRHYCYKHEEDTDVDCPMAREIHALFKDWRELAPNQSLPEIPSFSYDKEEYQLWLRRGAINYSKLLTNWRKVKG